jgi:ankyrin repeat protein
MGKTPISIRDGNKQTILHCTARSGHYKLLDFLMNQWKIAVDTTGIKFDVRSRDFDWRDRWYRTPVHWAVLNQRIASLQILLDGGCSAFPPQPKVNKRTSAKIESPLEMCERLYCEDHVIRDKIRALLVNAEY